MHLRHVLQAQFSALQSCIISHASFEPEIVPYFICRYLPETAGKTLEQVEMELYARRHTVAVRRASVQVANQYPPTPHPHSRSRRRQYGVSNTGI